MHAHARAAGQGRADERIVRVQLVERMAALVDDGVERAGQALLVVMGGDTHVVLGEVRGEGVLDLAQGAAAAVQAHDLHDGPGEPALLPHREMAEEEAVVHRVRALGDALHQGHQVLAQGSEEAVQLRLGHALLILVQQDVVRIAVRRVVARKAARAVQELLQVRRKEGVVAPLLGLPPGAGGQAQLRLVLDELLHGHAVHARHLLAQDLGLAPGDLVQLRLAAEQLADRALERVRGLELVDLLGERAHGRGIAAAPARGIAVSESYCITPRAC